MDSMSTTNNHSPANQLVRARYKASERGRATRLAYVRKRAARKRAEALTALGLPIPAHIAERIAGLCEPITAKTTKPPCKAVSSNGGREGGISTSTQLPA
jgi:hypothetical protein